MGAHGVSPDDGRDFMALSGKAAADAARAVQEAAVGTGVGPVTALALQALTVAVLAVADRLDTLIGAAFDELRPVATVAFPGGFEAARLPDDEGLEGGDRVGDEPRWGAPPVAYRMLRRLEAVWDPGDGPPEGWDVDAVSAALSAARCRARWLSDHGTGFEYRSALAAEAAIEELLELLEGRGA